MDLVKAELERKRKQLVEKDLCTKEKKYFKRSELRKIEEDEYFKNQKNSYTNIVIENVDESSSIQKFERERIEKEKGKIPPRKEVIKYFREKKQPIRLYGETDYESYQRMKRIQLLEPETVGLRNDLIAALDKIDDVQDEVMLNIERKRKDTNDEVNSKIDVETKENVIECEDLSKIKMILAHYVAKREGTAEDDATKAVVYISKTMPRFATKEEEEAHIKKEMDIASTYSLLSKWGNVLNSRPREEKLTYSGKIASATYTQTVEYARPLFKALKQSKYQGAILDSLVKIVVLLIDRNYLKANDAYLELAIGNSPWPLGVTNHGIHSRTAQEKIHAKNVAHVLNDETQRKYIQAIKRLMTKAQEFYPTDPSKCVNYMGKVSSEAPGTS